jgi:SAM-dependent methyltransferase
MLNYHSFGEYLKKNDGASFFGLRALRKMRGDAVIPYANDIFDFLNHKGVADAFEVYVKRSEVLRTLQVEFEKTGRYRAARCAEVAAIDREQYNLALLLSFICTSHRFEILETLVRFLRMPCSAPGQEVLSIGYGTGYELKLVFQEMPDWKLLAFDNSAESHQYASELLGFFGYPTNGLREEFFPLDPTDLVGGPYWQRFSKVILCELLEHLEDPATALRSMRAILHPKGLLFCTMAIKIAQEDHVYLYRSADEAREQVRECGLEIVDEILAPVVVLPFASANRADVFDKGNYVCIAKPK